ncbi:MAG: hypothetical protein HS126_13820 [Anaerolineales bacterium]|nr:hypothetical protein [Anaerolineales bacterium]
MEHKTWQKSKFNYPKTVPTMISPEERLYLYWLGRSQWSGEGTVVEIGPWLGGSTVCLAAGMAASGHETKRRLHVFDNFIWREFMTARAALSLQPGDSFKSYFLRNIREYEEIIEVRERALPDEPIKHELRASSRRFLETDRIPLFEGFTDGESIKILFIDGAKSWRGLRYLLKTLCGSLIPGKSYLVCQDYKFWGTYWVPIMMTRLAQYLEPVHNVLGGSTVSFRLISTISPQLLEAFEDSVLTMPTDQTLQELDRASALLRADGDMVGSTNVLLSKVSFLVHQDNIELAIEEFKKIQNSWPIFADTEHLERVRAYLYREKFRRIPRPITLKLISRLRRIGKNAKLWVLR